VAVAAVVGGSAVAAPQTPGATKRQHADIIVYSGRREGLILPALKAFEAESGIPVRVLSGSNTALASRILAERNNPRASVFISQFAPTCEVLRKEGVLEANSSPALDVIPRRFRAVDGSWVGLSGRARVIMYNRDQVRGAGVPTSIYDLLKPEWRGKIATPGRSEVALQSWAGLLIKQLGPERAESFFTRLKDNGLVSLANHTAVRQAVARGEFALGLVNHYYYHLQRAEGSTNIGIVYPDQQRVVRVRTTVRGKTVIRGELRPKNALGTFFNPAGVCLVKGGPAQAEARALIDWFTTARAQQLFAELNFEYPLRTGLSPTNGVRPPGRITQAPVDLTDVDVNAGNALLTRVGIQ
jgi:iron(III) transport system substrate-binding protein